jgi:hypothetical protein
LAHAAGEDHQYSIWPYYEVPKMVEKYDIDEVLYMAVPQAHSPFDVYFTRPLGPTGVPSEAPDAEYLLKPLSEKTLDPAAERFWKKALAKDLARLGPHGQAVFSDLVSLMRDPSFMVDLVELTGRPFGLLSKKVTGMRTSSGAPVGFHICFTPLPTVDPENFRSLWQGIARTRGIPWLDLSGPIRALRPTFGEVTDGGHEHFYLQGHALVAYLLSEELPARGIVKFEKGKE